MSVDFRQRFRSVAAKVEATPGTDATPTPAANAVRFENPTMPRNLETIGNEEVTYGIDRRPDDPGGGYMQFTGATLMKGAGTAGTAPEAGVLYRGAGFAETLLAADITGSAQGGTSSTIQLASGDAANVAVGMVVRHGPSGETRAITAVDSGTDTLTVYPDWTTAPSASDAYTVFACALYTPVDTGLEALSIYQWEHNKRASADALLTKLIGSMAGLEMEVPVRQPGRVNWTFRGKFAKPADVSDPGPSAYDSVVAAPFMGAGVYLGGNEIKLNSFSLSSGVEVQQPDDPADPFGYDVADINDRRFSGSINPPRALTSTRDVVQDFLDAKESRFWMHWGPSAGRRTSILIPQLRSMVPEEQQQNGYVHENIPFQVDEGRVYICIY